MRGGGVVSTALDNPSVALRQLPCTKEPFFADPRILKTFTECSLTNVCFCVKISIVKDHLLPLCGLIFDLGIMNIKFGHRGVMALLCPFFRNLCGGDLMKRLLSAWMILLLLFSTLSSCSLFEKNKRNIRMKAPAGIL